MKLVKPSSIAAAILIMVAIVAALAGFASHVNGGVPADSDKATCAVSGAEAGSQQGAGPVGAIHAHLCGFHFYNGDMKRQVRADHYCSHLNADVWQCIIYESDRRDARLVGVEYIISGALFSGLPQQEKKLWHSHRYEVMSGQLVALGVADAAERQLMREFAGTYGKAWYLWQVDRGDRLPMGLPKLMMGFTSDGQADPKLVSKRDGELGVDSAGIRARRAGMETPAKLPGADAWLHDRAFQIDDALMAGPQGK